MIYESDNAPCQPNERSRIGADTIFQSFDNLPCQPNEKSIIGDNPIFHEFDKAPCQPKAQKRRYSINC